MVEELQRELAEARLEIAELRAELVVLYEELEAGLLPEESVTPPV